jgi:hypothetical protein
MVAMQKEREQEAAVETAEAQPVDDYADGGFEV